MTTLFGAALRAHAGHPRAPAAIASPDGDLSYAELVARVERCAAWLVREGCTPSTAVGVSVVDETESLVVSLALLFLGLPQAWLSTQAPREMRLALATRLAVGRLVVDDGAHALPGIAASVWSSDACRTMPAVAVAALQPDPDASAVFASSSGTTGVPKVLALSQRVIAWRARQLASVQAFAPDERVLVPMSNQEYAGRSRRLYAPDVGCTSIDGPGGPQPISRLPAYGVAARVSTLQLTVLQARALVGSIDVEGRLPASTRAYLGASRMPSGLPAAFEARVGGRLYNRYGTTEIGIVATMYPDGDDGTPDSVGRPSEGVEVEIVGGDGRPLPRGEPGEIRLRAECMVRGYHDDPDATAKHFVDGWFYPRDVAMITAGGVLRFLGRKDDMMVLNGINIFPAEIERVLEEHPAVASAAAFPIPSAVHGDVPVAAVELRMPAAVDIPQLAAFARERLGVRAPRRITILAALPRNAAGKVAKRELARLLAPRATET